MSKAVGLEYQLHLSQPQANVGSLSMMPAQPLTNPRQYTRRAQHKTSYSASCRMQSPFRQAQPRDRSNAEPSTLMLAGHNSALEIASRKGQTWLTAPILLVAGRTACPTMHGSTIATVQTIIYDAGPTLRPGEDCLTTRALSYSI